VKNDPINIPANRRGFFYPLITSSVNPREGIKSGEGVPVLGEVNKEILRSAAVFIQALRKADLYHPISQAVAVFLPVRSVGVMGDGRKYDWVIALRAVETIDL
jgi:GMP synthase PP-ATPase subunit